MIVSLLFATCLMITCIRHFYKYVIKVPKNQWPLSVTIFYITAFITLLAILLFSSCSYTSERTSHLTSFVLAMAALSEVGIQCIAISQASSAMELGLYLRDIRNDNKTQSGPLMSSPGRKQSSGTKRKSFINVFLWVHIAIFFSIPCGFWILSSYIINR